MTKCDWVIGQSRYFDVSMLGAWLSNHLIPRSPNHPITFSCGFPPRYSLHCPRETYRTDSGRVVHGRVGGLCTAHHAARGQQRPRRFECGGGFTGRRGRGGAGNATSAGVCARAGTGPGGTVRPGSDGRRLLAGTPVERPDRALRGRIADHTSPAQRAD